MYTIFEELLREHHTTAYQVGKATGISTATLTDWKKGRSSPKADKLQKIADYFGVSVDYLLGKEQKEKPSGQKAGEPSKIELLTRRVEKLPEEDQERIIKILDTTLDIYFENKKGKK